MEPSNLVRISTFYILPLYVFWTFQHTHFFSFFYNVTDAFCKGKNESQKQSSHFMYIFPRIDVPQIPWIICAVIPYFDLCWSYNLEDKSCPTPSFAQLIPAPSCTRTTLPNSVPQHSWCFPLWDSQHLASPLTVIVTLWLETPWHWGLKLTPSTVPELADHWTFGW